MDFALTLALVLWVCFMVSVEGVQLYKEIRYIKPLKRMLEEARREGRTTNISARQLQALQVNDTFDPDDLT